MNGIKTVQLATSFTPYTYFCEVANALQFDYQGLESAIIEALNNNGMSESDRGLLVSFHETVLGDVEDWINAFVGFENEERHAIYQVLRAQDFGDVADLYEMTFYICDNIPLSLDEYVLEHVLFINADADALDNEDKITITLNFKIMDNLFTGEYHLI